MIISRPKGILVVLTGVALFAGGCGARVAPYFPATAMAPGSGGQQPQALGQPNGITATTVRGANGTGPHTVTSVINGSSGSSGVNGAGGTGGSGGSRTSGGGGGGGGLSSANFNLNPQAESAYCSGSAGNSASAPGVTPTSILAGNVSGLTGVVSDSFDPGYQAVTAAFDSVDRFGGICGRQLKLQTEDDQQSSSSNASDVQFLIPKVLAFVGSLSDADNGGVPAMVSAGVPDIGPAINTNRSNSSVYWSATGGSVTVRNGRAYFNNNWINGLRAYHDLPSSMAILAYSIPISAQAGEEYATLFKSEGVKICYSNYSIPPAPGTEMGSVVSAMQNANCGGVFTTMDVVGNADMLDDMSQDGFHPQLISTTYEGYTPQQISLAGEKQSQGLQVGLSSVPLSDSNSAVQLYQAELATYEPGKAPSEFGFEAWADAEMYIYALIQSGHNPTRASLINAMANITNWTTGGAFGAYTPHNRTGPTCIDMVEVQGNAFVRLWPSSGLYCTGQLVDVGPAS